MKYEREPLTKRQREVVRLATLGCNLYETAAILKIAANTVDNHKQTAMRRLGVNKSCLLTRVAIKLRITTLNDRLTLAEKRRSGRKQDGWN